MTARPEEVSTSGRFTRESDAASANLRRLCALIGANQDGVLCGDVRGWSGEGWSGAPTDGTTTLWGHRRAIHMHARYTVGFVRNGKPQASLLYGARGYTARHGRRETLEAAAQADPDCRDAAAGSRGRRDNDEDGRRGVFFVNLQ